MVKEDTEKKLVLKFLLQSYSNEMICHVEVPGVLISP